ncbi:hypothetical protein V8E36_007390 [Tilletia maclaganii]
MEPHHPRRPSQAASQQQHSPAADPSSASQQPVPDRTAAALPPPPTSITTSSSPSHRTHLRTGPQPNSTFPQPPPPFQFPRPSHPPHRPEVISHPYSTSIRHEAETASPSSSRRVSPIAGPSSALGSAPPHPPVQSYLPPRDAALFAPGSGTRPLQSSASARSSLAFSSRLSLAGPATSQAALLLQQQQQQASSSSSTPRAFEQQADMPLAFRFAAPDHSYDSVSSDDDSVVHDAYAPSLSSSDSDEDERPVHHQPKTKTPSAKGKRKAVTPSLPSTATAPVTASMSPSAFSSATTTTTTTPHPGAKTEPGPNTKPIPHTRKMPDGHIKRPPNAFMLYRSHIQTSGQAQMKEKDQSNASRIAGMLWRSISDEERAHWHAEAALAKQRHAAEHPEYKYKPAKRVDKAPRRRMKKKASAGEAQEHCATVADSLLKQSGHAEGLTSELRTSPKMAQQAAVEAAAADVGAKKGGGRRSRTTTTGANEDKDAPPKKRARKSVSSTSVDRQSDDDEAAASDRTGSKHGTSSTTATPTAAASPKQRQQRKNSLGYVIPPARKRSPHQKNATSSSSSSSNNSSPRLDAPDPSSAPNGSGSGSGGGPVATPTFATPPLSIPMRLRQPTALTNELSSNGGAGARSFASEVNFFTGSGGVGFGGGGVNKSLAARLGISSFPLEPISPTTVLPGMGPGPSADAGTPGASATSNAGLGLGIGLGPAANPNGSGVTNTASQSQPRTFSPAVAPFGLLTREAASEVFKPSPALSFAEQLARTRERNRAAAAAALANATTTTSSPPALKVASTSVSDDADADTANKTKAKRGVKQVAFSEDDVIHYAPERWPVQASEGGEGGLGGLGEDAEMEDADEFAAALAAADFGSSANGKGGLGLLVGGGEAGAAGGVGNGGGGGANDAGAGPTDLASISNALAVDGISVAERRRSVMAMLDRLAHHCAETEFRKEGLAPPAPTPATAKTSSTSFEKHANGNAAAIADARRFSELKQYYIRRWKADYGDPTTTTNGSGPPLTPTTALLSDQSLLLQGGVGIRPTVYWDEARPPPSTYDDLHARRPGGMASPFLPFGSPSDYASAMAAAASYGFGLGLSRRQPGVGMEMATPLDGMRATGWQHQGLLYPHHHHHHHAAYRSSPHLHHDHLSAAMSIGSAAASPTFSSASDLIAPWLMTTSSTPGGSGSGGLRPDSAGAHSEASSYGSNVPYAASSVGAAPSVCSPSMLHTPPVLPAEASLARLGAAFPPAAAAAGYGRDDGEGGFFGDAALWESVGSSVLDVLSGSLLSSLQQQHGFTVLAEALTDLADAAQL